MLGFLLGELKQVFVNGNTANITQKFKMAAEYLKLLYMIATKFQRLYPCF